MTRSFHIYCDGGFGNRFNGLISGMLLAQATGLQPIVVWPVNNWCGARYDEVLQTPAQVVERELVTYVPEQAEFHFLMTEDHLGMGVPNRSCLAMSSMEEAVDYIRQSPLPVFFHTPLIPPWMEKELVLRAVGSLQFKVELLAAADAFIAEQGLQDFFGIHIRKTDFGTRGADEEGLFNLVAQLSHKRFFVCSDDKAVEQRFAALSHVAVYPKRAHVEMLVQGDWNTATTDSSGRLYACNVNRSAQSVQDAVVDILLLSRSQVVRTTNSTFLNTAILIREANIAQAGPLATPPAAVARSRSAASAAPLSFVVSNPDLNFISRLHVKLPQAQIFDVYVQVTREYPAQGWEPCLFEVTINADGCVINFDRPGNWHHFKIDLHHGGIGTPEVLIERDPSRSDAEISNHLRQRNIVFLGCARQCGSRLGQTLTKLRELGSLFASYEVLVFENDSTDDTRAVLQQWAQHMPLRLICEDGLDVHLPTRMQRLAYARNRLLALAKAGDCDYVCWADMDGVVNELHPSAASFCSNFAHEAVWDAVFPVNTGPYYDIWAFRQRQVCPGDYGARINAVDAAFGKPLAFHFGLSHLQADFRLMAGWLPVESAFGGMGLYKRSALDFVRYEGMRDGVETIEHVTLNQGLAAKGCRLYINPGFQVDTHGTWPDLMAVQA